MWAVDLKWFEILPYSKTKDIPTKRNPTITSRCFKILSEFGSAYYHANEKMSKGVYIIGRYG